MGGHPAVRASAVRDTLDFLDRFQPGARAAVLTRVPPQSRRVIEETPRSGWIGVEHDCHTIDAMIEIFGRERAVDCWSGAVANLADKPLLGAFMSGMQRLLRVDPARVITWIPKGWPLVYRDLCQLEVRKDATGGARIAFVDVADEVRQRSNYFHSFHGVCRGVAALVGSGYEVQFAIARDYSSAEAVFARPR
jgi:hypothetical protein